MFKRTSNARQTFELTRNPESREPNIPQQRGERQQLTTMKCSCQKEVKKKGEKEVITHH